MPKKKITIRRAGADRYDALLDGNPSGLAIEKSPGRKHWGASAEWDVVLADDRQRVLLTGYGLHDVLHRLQMLADRLKPDGEDA
jgi:hypothetical protein